MADANARERAAFRLVEMLTPAAALGVECVGCGAHAGAGCFVIEAGRKVPKRSSCQDRYDAARAELHSLLLQLGIGV